jgi:hypothetical protein
VWWWLLPFEDADDFLDGQALPKRPGYQMPVSERLSGLDHLPVRPRRQQTVPHAAIEAHHVSA